MSGFEAFYASPAQHPWLLFAAGLAGVAWALRSPGLAPEMRRYVQALGVLSLLDAWLTSNEVLGLGRLPAWASTIVPLCFVLAGDLRYLLLVECGAAGGRLAFTARGIGRAVALTLVVPVTAQLVVSGLAGADGQARVLFLVYEVSFVALTVALMAWHPGAARGRWPRRVSGFVALYYALWASADAIILATGADAGFGLRVIPNVLYYGGLIAVIGRSAAADRRDAAHRAPERPRDAG